MASVWKEKSIVANMKSWILCTLHTFASSSSTRLKFLSSARKQSYTRFLDLNNLMIETEELTRTFGPTIAVDGLTLTIRSGEVFGFLGPNGAGKTTTIRMLCTLIAKTKGMAYVNGLDIR